MPDSSPKPNPDPKRSDRPGRERFAAGGLELEKVLIYYFADLFDSLDPGVDINQLLYLLGSRQVRYPLEQIKNALNSLTTSLEQAAKFSAQELFEYQLRALIIGFGAQVDARKERSLSSPQAGSSTE